MNFLCRVLGHKWAVRDIEWITKNDAGVLRQVMNRIAPDDKIAIKVTDYLVCSRWRCTERKFDIVYDINDC